MHATDLYESLDSALWSLGEQTRNLIISAFEAKGVVFRPNDLDLRAVEGVLSELFGSGADAIIVSAYDSFARKLLIGFDESRIDHPVLKIRKWLEVNGGEKSTAQ